ncbi:MAG: flagellar biosynthetic protein FliR [Victivallales bacterium]|nr:flagellar biosynthetic protein FliR [Victivallales bacterium]
MNFQYDLAVNAVKWLAIMSRMTAFMIAMPLFTPKPIPMRCKAAFLAIVSFLLVPAVPPAWFAHPLLSHPTVWSLTLFLAAEAVLGLVVSLVFFAILEIFKFGGAAIDREVGFAMAQVMDPVTNLSSTLFSNFLVQIFIMIFLLFNGHQEVLRLAAFSFRALPPGTLLLNEGVVGGINGLIARVLVVGFQLALPVIAVNLLVNVAMAILSRVGQEFPVLMLSFPLRFGLGFLILIATAPIMLSICRGANELLFEWLTGLAGG